MNVKMILGDKGTDVLTIDSSNKLSDAIAVLENRSVGILVTTSPEEPLTGVTSEKCCACSVQSWSPSPRKTNKRFHVI